VNEKEKQKLIEAALRYVLTLKKAESLFENNVVALSPNDTNISPDRDLEKYPIIPTYFFKNRPYKSYMPQQQHQIGYQK
jgi:hypothetical protein